MFSQTAPEWLRVEGGGGERGEVGEDGGWWKLEGREEEMKPECGYVVLSSPPSLGHFPFSVSSYSMASFIFILFICFIGFFLRHHILSFLCLLLFSFLLFHLQLPPPSLAANRDRQTDKHAKAMAEADSVGVYA